MSIEDMERKMAERVFQLRADRIKEQLRGLPLPEKFRAVADFLDAGQNEWAQSLGRLAMGDLETHNPMDVDFSIVRGVALALERRETGHQSPQETSNGSHEDHDARRLDVPQQPNIGPREAMGKARGGDGREGVDDRRGVPGDPGVERVGDVLRVKCGCICVRCEDGECCGGSSCRAKPGPVDLRAVLTKIADKAKAVGVHGTSAQRRDLLADIETTARAALEREPGDCHGEDGRPAECVRCSRAAVKAFHENGARCPRAPKEDAASSCVDLEDLERRIEIGMHTDWDCHALIAEVRSLRRPKASDSSSQAGPEKDRKNVDKHMEESADAAHREVGYLSSAILAAWAEHPSDALRTVVRIDGAGFPVVDVSGAHRSLGSESVEGASK